MQSEYSVIKDEQEDKDLRCPNCLYYFSSITKPYILPCSHNLCLKCINIFISSKQAFCPQCKAPFSKVHNDLQVNYAFLNLVIKILKTKIIFCKKCYKIFTWMEHHSTCDQSEFIEASEILENIKKLCDKSFTILKFIDHHKNILTKTKSDIYNSIDKIIKSIHLKYHSNYETNINTLLSRISFINIEPTKKELIKFLEMINPLCNTLQLDSNKINRLLIKHKSRKDSSINNFEGLSNYDSNNNRSLYISPIKRINDDKINSFRVNSNNKNLSINITNINNINNSCYVFKDFNNNFNSPNNLHNNFKINEEEYSSESENDDDVIENSDDDSIPNELDSENNSGLKINSFQNPSKNKYLEFLGKNSLQRNPSKNIFFSDNKEIKQSKNISLKNENALNFLKKQSIDFTEFLNLDIGKLFDYDDILGNSNRTTQKDLLNINNNENKIKSKIIVNNKGVKVINRHGEIKESENSKRNEQNTEIVKNHKINQESVKGNNLYNTNSNRSQVPKNIILNNKINSNIINNNLVNNNLLLSLSNLKDSEGDENVEKNRIFPEQNIYKNEVNAKNTTANREKRLFPMKKTHNKNDFTSHKSNNSFNGSEKLIKNNLVDLSCPNNQYNTNNPNNKIINKKNTDNMNNFNKQNTINKILHNNLSNFNEGRNRNLNEGRNRNFRGSDPNLFPIQNSEKIIIKSTNNYDELSFFKKRNNNDKISMNKSLNHDLSYNTIDFKRSKEEKHDDIYYINKIIKNNFNSIKDTISKLNIFTTDISFYSKEINEQLNRNQNELNKKIIKNYNLLLKNISNEDNRHSQRSIITFMLNTKILKLYDCKKKEFTQKDFSLTLSNFKNFDLSCSIAYDDFDLIFISGIILNNIVPNNNFIVLRWSNSKIEKSTKMYNKRAYHSSLYFKNKVYIIGGVDENDNTLSDCESYTVNKQKFEFMPKLNYPRANSSICLFNNKYLYVFRGSDHENMLDTIEYLNINSVNDGWNVFFPDNPGLCWFGCEFSSAISIDQNKILIFGGCNKEGKIFKESFILEPNDKIIYRTNDLKMASAFKSNGSFIMNNAYAIDFKNTKDQSFTHSFDCSNYIWNIN